jgi:multicomponent Na+:H+ antiporter subunit E
MIKWLVHFLFLFGFWIVMTWTIAVPDLIAGCILALIFSTLFNSLFEKNLLKLLNPVRLWWFLVYIPVFLYHMIVANLDVAYRVINPGLPINPGIVKIKTSLKTDLAKTFLANSITLTPGTMTVEIKDEFLYIHWINVLHTDVENATNDISKVFEKYIKRIFE